jgi:glycosyltransferase involved in cell wall biosynthesis
MRPSISVVTVTLNAAKSLPGLITSLRNQTDADFEYIVIDGASKDGTQDIIASASNIVTYTISEPDHGFFDALNKAIRAVKTDFYIVMGADDLLEPDAIANFKAVAERTSADVVIADVKAGNKIRRGYYPKRRWLGPARMITSHSVGTYMRTNLHDKFGIYSWRFPLLADIFYVKRLCLSPDVKVVAGDFLSGEFAMEGFSNNTNNFVRLLCEYWLVQRETGENPLLQYLLFQLRVLRYLPRVITDSRR